MIGNRIRERVMASAFVAAGIAEGGDHERREDDQERGEGAEAEQHQPEERWKRRARRACGLPSREAR